MSTLSLDTLTHTGLYGFFAVVRENKIAHFSILSIAVSDVMRYDTYIWSTSNQT